ncbi:MAG: type II secretion system F family protein [Rhizobiaceae bacterium]|nr:type II secretion system F family protein [Rhizobiaceae bacterium]
MAAFLFRAVDAAGRKHGGVIEAGSAAGARATLRERQLLPISVEATTAASKKTEGAAARPAGFSLGRRKARMSGRDLTLVTRQLSTLISSDVRIEEAIRTVAEQHRSEGIASILLNVRAAILDGRSFAQALSDYPDIFTGFYRATIAAGEQSGKLGSVLLHLSDFVENRQKNRQTVQLALLYPALLAVVSLGIIVLLLTYVVPDITRVFIARGAELPFLTRAMIASSDAVTAYGWMAAAALAAGAFVWSRWARVPKNRLAVHRAISRNALTARFSSQINAAQFVGTLATLVQSEVRLVEALKASAGVTPNHFVRERIAGIATRVEEGVSLRSAVNEAACFPPMVAAMIASGETSGKLGEALARAAADQQQELDARVKALVALVEPAVLLLMGGLVLVLVLSIMLPIIGLNDLAGS